MTAEPAHTVVPPSTGRVAQRRRKRPHQFDFARAAGPCVAFGTRVATDAAHMATPAWRAGANVRVRGRRWRIESIEEGDDCTALRLADLEGGGRRTLTILTPFDRPRLLDRPASLKVVSPRRCLHVLDRAILVLHPFGSLAHLASAAVTVMPHQLEPALAMLRHGRTRVLIADAVGLGKTIQAGIVMRELSTTDSCRALVLTPAGLREQWQRELATRFHLASLLTDADWLRRTASDLPAGVNPWSLPGVHVASFDFVKRPEALRPLEDVAWDIVVVDEAHAASAGTDRRAAIDAIAGRAQRVLLLTATPPVWDALQFRALCEIGRASGDEPPPTCFARTGAELRLRPPRRTTLAAVAPTIAEVSMHEVLQRYSDRVWREATSRGDDRARLAAIVLRKRALSSAGSLLASVLRRIDLLANGRASNARQLSLPLDDEDPLEDDDDAPTLGAPGLADAGRERRWLAAIVESARAAARDESKIRWLLRLLRRVREPVTVFTEYRDTLTRLERRVRATGRSLAVLHGGMDPRERAAVASALDNRVLTLLATDAAAEGLNLQHHSRIVVHFELPWNPSRLEQRAGRVDRIGQMRRVHEVALVSSTAAERLVLRPLATRAARAGALSRFGSTAAALSESRVAAAVMSGTTIDVASAPHEGAVAASVEWLALGAEAAIEAARIEQQRALIARSSTGKDDGGPVAARVRSRDSGAPALALVYAVSLQTTTGRCVHAEPVAAAFDADPLSSGRTWKDLRATLLRVVHTSTALARWIDEQKREIESRVEPIAAAAHQRQRHRRCAIEGAQRAAAARRIVQLKLPGAGPPSREPAAPIDLPPLEEPQGEWRSVLVAALLRARRPRR
jgi:superfamily II DNA or RNA helicase